MRRNALLGSAAFQAWAARWPIFRTISRRYAAAQFDLVAGFVYSQILAAYVETGLFDQLNGQLRSVDEIAGHTKLGREAAERLLRAGQALKLAESPQNGLWTLGEAGAPLSANPGAIAMIRHHNLLYRDLADPVTLLAKDRREQTALSAYWTYASRAEGEGDTAGYSALMAATQPMVWQQILPAYRFGAHQRMLDIGGGSGAFANAVKVANPALRVGIFDLPAVIDHAKLRLGDGDDTDLHAGSFKTDSIPADYDLVTLVRILHDHDDDVVEALLAKIHLALPRGGRLLIVEPMAESSGAQRMGDAYFGLYLWAMGSGRPRSQSQYRHMLQKAGFSAVKAIKTDLPIITSAIVAAR
jgi:demethylspheroidene O-methyltransferase